MRRWNPTAAIILFTALITAAGRFVATDWAEGLSVAITLSIFGLVVGVALGTSRFQRAGIYLLSLGYSLFFVPWALGGSQYPGMAWLDRWTNLSGRLSQSFALFLSQQPVDDTLLFTTLAAVVYWILSLHAGYALARKSSFLGSILPSGIVLFLVQIYDSWSGARIGLLAVFLFLCLLLLGQLTFAGKQRLWKEQRVWISSATSKEMTLLLVISALLIILIAWLLPGSNRSVSAVKAVWDDITSPWKEAREDLGNAIAGLEHGNTIPTADYYGESMSLGRSGASGDSVLFTVRTPMTATVSRYYWSVRTYDAYNNAVWSSTPGLQRSMLPRQPALLTDGGALWPSAEFVFSVPSSLLSVLPTPARPVWLNRQAMLDYLPLPGEQVEPLSLRVDPPIQPGETYTVHASVANPTRRQLRAAGSAYPDWVTSRYLQLPDDFPQEIASLAAEIVAGKLTPYDQAAAITDYLRTGIRYNRSINPAPEGQEPLAWFLLITKEGFCNYYASAEVLMLRSVGIPARLVVGYSEGERQGSNQRIVRSRNAHAWPEVYFPGLGWVEFEPTSAELPITRPSGEIESPFGGVEDPGRDLPQDEELDPDTLAPSLPVGEEDAGGQPAPNSFLRLTVFLLIAMLATTGLVLLFLFGLGEKRRRRLYAIVNTPTPVLMISALESLSLPSPHWLLKWVRWTRLGSVERAFASVHQSLHWLGIRRDPARTAAQSAALLTSLLPGTAAPINTLLNEYQQTLFSHQPGNAEAARQAAALLQRAALPAALRLRLNTLAVRIRKKDWRRTKRNSDLKDH